MEAPIFVWLLFVLISTPTSGVDEDYEWGEWSRPTHCSVTCGRGTSSRSRYCLHIGANKGNSSRQGLGKTCRGPSEVNSPCFELACPVEGHQCNCGCDLRESMGDLLSVLSYEESRLCDWKIRVPRSSKVRLVVKELQLKQGKIQIYYGDGMSKVITRHFDSQSGEEKLPLQLLSEGSSVNVSLMFYKTMVALSGNIKFHAYYEEVTEAPLLTGQHQTLKVSAVIGIAACVVVIFLATFILVYRYCKRARQKLDENVEVAEDNDNTSSSTSSNRSRPKVASKKSSFTSSVQQRLLSGSKGSKSKSGKSVSSESKDSPYESDHRRPLINNNAYPDRVVSAAGRTLPYTASFWPMQQRRYSSEVEYRETASHQLMNQPVFSQQQPATISPAPLNIHMPHPQLGYMIRQAQLSFPPEVPAHVYQQQLMQHQLQQLQQPLQPLQPPQNVQQQHSQQFQQ